MLLTFPALRLKALILLAQRLLLKDTDNVDPFGKSPPLNLLYTGEPPV